MQSALKAAVTALIVSLAIGGAAASPQGSASRRKARHPRLVPQPAAAAIPVTAGIKRERKQLDSTTNDAPTNAGHRPPGPPVELRMTRGASKKFDVRTLPPIPPHKRQRPEREPPPFNPTEAVPQSITVQPNAFLFPGPTAAAPATVMNFDGLDYASWGAGHPPDTNGDVGPVYYIQTINTSIGIYRKSDGVREAAFTFDTFMSQGNLGNLCDSDNMGDPVVLYDTFEDRWIITDFAFTLDGSQNVIYPPGAFQCFAVSMNGDPVSGGWNFYSINTTGGLGDYPKFGIWPDGLYMSVNMFDYSDSGGFQNARVYAFNKAQMYAGNASVQVVSFDAPSSNFTLLPSNARLQAGTPPAGRPNYFVDTTQYTNALDVYELHVDWSGATASTFTGPHVPIATTSFPNFVPANAATPGNALDVLPYRAMMQNQYTNIGGTESLWATHTVRRADVFGFAAPRWYQVNVTGGSVNTSLPQAATWDPDGSNVTYRYVPSLAVDRASNMAIGYSTSNSTTNPGIKYAGRLSTDTANTFSQTEQVLIQGTGTQTGTCGGSTCKRWGDYAAMTLDPDGCTFWLTSEYYVANGLDHHTRIGSFRYSQCTQLGAGGTISGTVTAASGGAPISGATVQLGSRSTTTNGSGAYSFASLPAGTYPTITASYPGYVSSTTSSIVVTDGGTTTRNFSLAAAPTSACPTDTTQADFQSGVSNNVDLTTSAGNVKLFGSDFVDQQNTNVLTNSGFTLSTTYWDGQTFTPSVTGLLTKVDLDLGCFSSCSGLPSFTVAIRATSGDLPSGPDLATATIPGFTGSGGYFTATFGSPITVTAGTRYAMTIHPDASTVAILVAFMSSGNVYASGQAVQSNNSGSTWYAAQKDGIFRDLGFRVYINAGYALSGDLTSSTKDSNPGVGVIPLWSNLTWTGSTPTNTTLRFQVAGSNSASGPFNFVGPDGTGSTYFTTSPGSLSRFHGRRYLQYKAYLSTTDSAVTPTLNDATVCYSNQANDAPVLAAIGNKSVAEGALLAFTISATDSDGDTIAYSATGLPSGASLNTTSGAFSWTPAVGQAGAYNVTFNASDGLGGTDSEAITITVTGTSPSGVVATASSATSVNVSWVAGTGAVSYQILRRGAGGGYGIVGTSASLGFVDNTASANTAYLYVVRGVDSGGNPSPNSAPDLATTVVFTDDPLVAGTTIVKAVHFDQMRQAINAVRTLASVGTVVFTDPSLGSFVAKKVHIDEMRSALDAARTSLALPALVYTDPTIVATTTIVKTVHVTELRNGVK